MLTTNLPLRSKPDEIASQSLAMTHWGTYSIVDP
jgi:hypothetical protein